MTDTLDQDVTKLVALLAPIGDFRRRLYAMAVGAPASCSAAQLDSASFVEGGTTIYASQNITMGVDHLLAWQMLIEARVIPGFAHMTLLRSAIEGAATARWLIGSDSSDERIRRAAIYGLEDRRHRRNLEAEIEKVGREQMAERGKIYEPHKWEGGAKSGRDRYTDHLAAMTVAGIAKEDPPKLTTLIDDYGPGAHIYQLTSAFAHRREWAMAFNDELDRIEDTGLAGGGAIQVQASSSWAITMTEIAMDEIGEALAVLDGYVGRTAAPTQ